MAPTLPQLLPLSINNPPKLKNLLRMYQIKTKMTLGKHHHANPTLHVPPPPTLNDPTVEIYSIYDVGNRRLPPGFTTAGDGDGDEPVDAYSCDEFRMFEFKVRRCVRGRSHDWNEYPYAHIGEKSGRRDPRKFHYSDTACTDFGKGYCGKGYACEYAHGALERWLHPARYRTLLCEDGSSCRRRVCFFAHTAEQLRLVPPHRRQFSMLEEMASLKNKEQLERAKSMMGNNRRSVPVRNTGFGSPRGPLTRPGFSFYSRKSRCRLR